MKTITIKGKSYPIDITLGAMIRFKAITGKDISEAKEGDVTDTAMFMYCAVKSASMAANVDFDWEFEAFCDHLSIDDLNKFGQGTQKKTRPTTPTKVK